MCLLCGFPPCIQRCQQRKFPPALIPGFTLCSYPLSVLLASVGLAGPVSHSRSHHHLILHPLRAQGTAGLRCVVPGSTFPHLPSSPRCPPRADSFEPLLRSSPLTCVVSVQKMAAPSVPCTQEALIGTAASLEGGAAAVGSASGRLARRLDASIASFITEHAALEAMLLRRTAAGPRSAVATSTKAFEAAAERETVSSDQLLALSALLETAAVRAGEEWDVDVGTISAIVCSMESGFEGHDPPSLCAILLPRSLLHALFSIGRVRDGLAGDRSRVGGRGRAGWIVSDPLHFTVCVMDSDGVPVDSLEGGDVDVTCVGGQVQEVSVGVGGHVHASYTVLPPPPKQRRDYLSNALRAVFTGDPAGRFTPVEVEVYQIDSLLPLRS